LKGGSHDRHQATALTADEVKGKLRRMQHELVITS
jgi:hypothetical protein